MAFKLNFVERDPQLGIEPTIATADWLNMLEQEIAGTVEASGLVLDPLSNGQLALAIQRLTGGAPAFRNLLINGDFGVEQRDPLGYANLAASTDTRTIDRWIVNPGTKTQVVVARDPFTLGQSDVPGNPTHHMRVASASVGSGGAIVVKHRVEGVGTLAGRTASVGGYLARLGSSPVVTGIQARLRQHFGTGGSPSADVVTAFPDTWDVDQVAALFLRYTGTVLVPAVLGKTRGTNGDDYLELEIDLGTISSVFSLGFADWQLEDGGSATAYQRLPFDIELRRCRRYFESSYEPGTPPGTVTTAGSSVSEENSGSAFAQNLAERFQEVKRATPTVTWWNPATGAQNSVDNGGTARAVSSTQQASKATTGYPAIATSSGQVNGHWTADADL